MYRYLFMIALFRVGVVFGELVEVDSDLDRESSTVSGSDGKVSHDDSINSFIDEELVKINDSEIHEHNNIVEINVEDDGSSNIGASGDKRVSSYIEIKSAVIQFLNQDSAVHERKKMQVGQEYKFEKLRVSLKKCFMSAPGEPLSIWAYLVIEESLGSEYKEVFSGWMSSSKPSANTLESRTYDVRVESDANEY